MKKSAFLLFVLAGVALAQQATPPPQAPEAPRTAVVTQARVDRMEKATESDVNCAGFISQQRLDRLQRVLGGWHTPNTVRYGARETIYLEGSYKEGDLVYLVRELRDPNRYELFKGQRGLIRAVGQPYADLGRARIIALRGGVAVAEIEYSCDSVVPGDLAIPYFDRQPINYKATALFDRFPAAPGEPSGRILLAKDFDTFVGNGAKVYLNIGSNQGVKPGDMFRAMRGYRTTDLDEADVFSYSATTLEDTQKNEINLKAQGQKLPRRALGEMVVLSVTPTSSTAMITFALEDVHIGDAVEPAAAR